MARATLVALAVLLIGFGWGIGRDSHQWNRPQKNGHSIPEYNRLSEWKSKAAKEAASKDLRRLQAVRAQELTVLLT